MRVIGTGSKLTASFLSIAAGATVAVCVGLLVVGYIQDVRHAPHDKARVDAMLALVREDVSQLPALNAELQRQTQASVRRGTRTETLTNVLIAASILFLVGTKWLMALNGRRLPALSRISPRHASGPSRSGGLDAQAQPGSSEACQCHCVGTESVDPTVVDEIVERLGRNRHAVIPILHAVQARYRYLPAPVLRRVCETTDITPAQMAGVSTFYTQFRHTPVGEHIVKVCHGTACHVAGAPNINEEVRRYAGIAAGTDTDPQRRFTIEEVACMGCCTLAPVIQIDGVTHGHMTPDVVPDALDACSIARRDGTGRRTPRTAAALRSPPALTGEIRIGLGSCCVAGGSGRVYEALRDAVAAAGATASIKRVGCVGMCHRTPLVEAVLPDGTSALYAGVDPRDARSIVRRHFPAGGVGRRIADTASTLWDDLRSDGRHPPVTHRSIEVRDPPVAAFLGPQKHIATEHGGRIDPTDFDEYVHHDGFVAFERCVKAMTPEEVIDAIRQSGLRGRGGAGFPTGVKWSRVRAASGSPKYIICNGDEGDPGAFMDRMMMESFPYRIIEGMAIAAYAVGAEEGYFYIRAEYPLAVQRIGDALTECEKRHLIGGDILGSGVTLRLKIMQGAGAFVCGEETALMASIEGRRGSPRLRPPYPADRGLWGRPTLVNNVETYATVPWIMRNGAAAFAGLGTEASKGTKVFALAGKVRRGGLIEVPMGVTIREIVEEIGGGIKAGRSFKAVQIGGPSGGCIPASLADTPVDYEALTQVGAIMGSGGLVVLDDSDCMVDIARYFLAFTQDQSCGKCTFCRVGTRRMLDILNRLCAGEGRSDDLDTLADLAMLVRRGSLCGLGKTAPNPVLSTLRYFRDEYEAHLKGRCPAGKCKALITYCVTDRCIGCTICAQHCPADAIRFTPYEKHVIDDEKCTRCDTCRTKCPEEAIEVV